jgi:ABC-type lipoprotein release transport system permease subunit
MFWLRIAALFLLRSVRSTLILSLMVLSAVSTMIFLAAMCVGVNDAMIRNSVELYAGHITASGLPADLAEEKLRVPGVRKVLKRNGVPGILGSDANMEAVVMIVVDADEEINTTALAKKTISGHYPERGTAGIYLGRETAEKLRVHPGDSVTFGSGIDGRRFSLEVAGTYRTGFDQLDRGMAFCPRGTLELGETPWSAAVFLEEGVDPAVVTAAYEAAFTGLGQFRTWSELMPDLKELIDLNYVSMGIVLVVVFGVVSLGVGCAFVIFILKNLREFGIMKAMGVTPWESAWLIAVEAIWMSLTASCLAVGVGALVTLLVGRTGIDLGHFTSHNRYFTVSGVIFPRLTWFSLTVPPVLALFSSLVAAVWPAVIVIRKRAADILNIV